MALIGDVEEAELRRKEELMKKRRADEAIESEQPILALVLRSY